MTAIKKQCECCDVQQLIDQVSLLTDEVNKLKTDTQKEVKHWKANHDNILKQFNEHRKRPDILTYKQSAEIAILKAKLKEFETIGSIAEPVPEVLTDKENRVLIIPKSDKKCEFIDGAYYKCWWRVTDILPSVRVFKDGMMHDGDKACFHCLSYARIEPLETKKYGLWVAADENGRQYLYTKKPKRGCEAFFISGDSSSVSLGELKILPDQTWEDEPVEI